MLTAMEDAMNFDRPMSDKLAELIKLGLIQQSAPTNDFRMPTARVYVPLTTEYATFDSLGQEDGVSHAELVGRSAGDTGEAARGLAASTAGVRSY